jgi:large subunit ribosomal protein L4
MLKVPVYKQDGSQSGEIELNPLLFEAPVHERLLHLVTVAYAGNQRRGTHDTKGRKEVQGGGKKPWRQKGTGRARQGSIRAPQWRGGGTVFGPTPRDYDTRIPEEMRRRALIGALSIRAREGQVTVLEEFQLEAPKTKVMVGILKALGLAQTKALGVVKEMNAKVKLAARNLDGIFVLKRAHELNAYHVLRRPRLIVEKEALGELERRLLGESTSKQKEMVHG